MDSNRTATLATLVFTPGSSVDKEISVATSKKAFDLRFWKSRLRGGKGR